MKKIRAFLAVVLAAAMLLPCVPLSFAAAPVLGDADGSGEVQPADARLVLRMSVSLEKKPEDITLLDVDADGELTSADARLILRYAVKLETAFPAAEKLSQPEETPVQVDPAGFAPLLATNFKGDTGRLKNNTGDRFTLRCSPSLRVQTVSTFHWNFGRGAAPGKIWIRDVDNDKTYGPWQATGRRYQGVADAIWDVFLDDFDWKAYTAYEVLDSDPATRSYSDDSGGPISELRGWRDWPPVAPMLKKQGGFSGGLAGPAKGAMKYGELSVDFGDRFDGDAVLMDDRSGVPRDDPDFKVYDLLLTGDSINDISISLDAPQLGKGEAYQMQVGIPVKDGDKEGTLWFDLDTEWKNGKATARAYPAFAYEQLADVSFEDGRSLTSAMYDAGTKIFDLTMLPLDLLDDGVNALVDLGDKSVKMFRLVLKRVRLYASGDFLLAIPNSLEKITDQGARYLLDDLNKILNIYREEYDIHRDKWPMTVNVGWMCPPLEGGDALFTMPLLSLGGRVGRNQVGVNNSYMKIDQELLSYQDYRFMDGKYEENSAFLYSTVAHELFHFVQRNYVSKGRTGVWVDESSATYVGTKMLETIGIQKYHDQNYGREPRMQFDMLRQSFSLPSQEGVDQNYISPVLFDFLTQVDPHALRKLYETLRDGSMFSSWATVLEKAMGTSMRQLTIQYYHFLNEGALFAKNYEGWYLAEKAMDPNDHDLDAFVEVVDLEQWQKAEKGTHSFSVGPYGVHFIVFKKGAKTGAMDYFEIGNFSQTVAIDGWGSHQTYQPDYRSAAGWEHFYSDTFTAFVIDTHSEYIVYAFVNGTGNRYGGWFGKKVSFDYEYRNHPEEMSTWDGFQGRTAEYPAVNGDLLDTVMTTAGMSAYEKGGKRTKLVDGKDRGESRIEMDIKGDSLNVTLYGAAGETLYSGTLAYDHKTGAAFGDGCKLQFRAFVRGSANTGKSDIVWGNLYCPDGSSVVFTCWVE